MKVRIGIDVGGTFTDAAVIDNETYELIGSEKVPTTHSAATGVAAGIVEVLQAVMQRYNISPDDVAFIAHGTTQATNALLEGDVEKVGIITIGSGMEGIKSKADTQMGEIRLTSTKELNTCNRYIDSNSSSFHKDIARAIVELKSEGAGAIVAAEAFSVDDPENENEVIDMCRDAEIPGTATADISKLYGLRVRTRTAVVNASIMPKMLNAAYMTSDSIKKAGIKANLMVMRCDGGVMTVDEVRKRPILTILSGPAAGVAGALMHEKLPDGLFFEVGGTSTDISCVKDGKVMVRYSQIGGHKTFLTSLDVRTVGIGGGSMIQMKDGLISDTGPRSAHIAGLDYEVYADSADIVSPVLKTIAPTKTDPDYGYIECSNGKRFALTLSGAANICGYVSEGDYAFGNIEAAELAWKPLADSMGVSVKEAAMKALEYAAKKNGEVARQLMADYNMNPRTTVFIGGGGGACSVVPHLAQSMGHRYKIAKNAPVISTIGVALALVRDVVERTIANPTEQDILEVRREAEQKAIKAGAAPNSIEVNVEIDTKKNIVRAIAIGNTELRSKDLNSRKLTAEDVLEVAGENMQLPTDEMYIKADNGYMFVVMHDAVTKKMFGLQKIIKHNARLVDDEGVIRLQKENATVKKTSGIGWEIALRRIIEDCADYGDGGEQLPNTYIIFGKRLINLSGMSSVEQIISIARIELSTVRDDDQLIYICSDRMD